MPDQGTFIIDMTLIYILAATLLAALLSISLAAWMSFVMLSRLVERMVAFSVGILLGAALLHMMPEALQSHVDAHTLFALFLLSVIVFFLLERFDVLRHSHHHEGDEHHHGHGFDVKQAGRGGLPILIGDGIHNFADGILIAAAFLADPSLGVIAAASIIAHEIPQEVGDFMVLLNAGFSKRRAYFYNLLSSLAGVAGGVTGYFVLEHSQDLIPYALVIASASFIYIALSDLMPQMHREGRRKEAFFQIAFMGVGLATIYSLFVALHSHAH
jgi:zinc and cadmium transporter